NRSSNSNRNSSSKKHKPHDDKHSRPANKRARTSPPAESADSAERIPRPAKRLAKSSALSASDAGVVNANRERVGSLPASPRPRREPLDVRRSPPLRPAKKEAQSPSPAPPKRRPAKPTTKPTAAAAAQPAAASREASPNLSGDEPDAASQIISSADAVRQSETHYAEYFSWATADHQPTHVALHLPGGAAGAHEHYSLMMPRSYDRDAEAREEYLPVNDLLATVRAVGLLASPELRRLIDDHEHGIVRRLERARNRRNGDDFVAAVRDFNRLLDEERAAGRLSATGCRPPPEVALHVIEQTYNRVVAPTVGLLRQYKAFSNNVYGEILPTLVSDLIARTGITSECTFADLGCGIGNVVLQVAAQTGCRAHGVEIMKVPARFALRQAREFAHRMKLYGLSHGAVTMLRADFCESADVHRLLPTVDVLLVNNYAFDSALNHNLLQMFLDLKDGARIVSLKPFVTPDYKINARN
ncbi:Nucleosomal histone H3-Lys79 methylase, partial [Coemansia sp. RSA 2603]